MSENLRAKEAVVAEIKDKLSRAQSVIMVDYKGLTVAEDTALRNNLRKAGVEYKIYKNTMVARAADELGITGLEQYLKGPSSFAFGYNDAVAPAKVLSDYIKSLKKTQMTIKAGILESKAIDAEGVRVLSEMPPKEVLVARMLVAMNAPISGLAGVLSATLRSLVYAINAVKEAKEA